MPRFALLFHDTPPDFGRPPHWDLLLETGAALRAWALLEAPQVGKTVQAEALADHRLIYLDYQGPISGGRGHVRRLDAGLFQTLCQQQDEWILQLEGAWLACRCALRRDEAGAWTATFMPPASSP